MTTPNQASVSTAARPSTDTTVAEFGPLDHGDEEKNVAVKQENSTSDSDNDEDTDDQRIMNAAWGRRGKVWMWVGYVCISSVFGYC